jgi:hypothetical protein
VKHIQFPPDSFARRINHFLPDFYEMEAKKSPIFSLPFHKNQVKSDLSFFEKIRDGS